MAKKTAAQKAAGKRFKAKPALSRAEQALLRDSMNTQQERFGPGGKGAP